MAQALTPDLIRSLVAKAQDAITSARRSIEVREAELEDLLAAMRILASMSGTSETNQSTESEMLKAFRVGKGNGADFNPNERSGNPYKIATNKAFMWEALKDSRQLWMTANELQVLASLLRGAEIPMSSISPSLTDMKNDGAVERNGLQVALTLRLNENGEPNGHTANSPDAGRVTAPPYDDPDDI